MHGIELKEGQDVRKIPGELAQSLADLNGVQRDLEFIAQSCRVIEVRKKSLAAAHIRKACFDSAVLRYRRCFNNGIRDLVPKSIMKALTPNQLELHERIMALADRSVAHCVDGSEENIPILIVGPTADRETRLQISVMSASVSHHNVVRAPKFELLVIKLRKLVRAHCDKIAERVMRDIKAGGPSGLSSFLAVQRNITQEGETISEKYHGRIKAKAGKIG